MYFALCALLSSSCKDRLLCPHFCTMEDWLAMPTVLKYQAQFF